MNLFFKYIIFIIWRVLPFSSSGSYPPDIFLWLRNGYNANNAPHADGLENHTKMLGVGKETQAIRKTHQIF